MSQLWLRTFILLGIGPVTFAERSPPVLEDFSAAAMAAACVPRTG